MQPTWDSTPRLTSTLLYWRGAKAEASSRPILITLACSRSPGTDPSLILFRGGDWSERDVRDRWGAILQGISATDISQSILTVDRKRVRRRRLPIG